MKHFGDVSFIFVVLCLAPLCRGCREYNYYFPRGSIVRFRDELSSLHGLEVVLNCRNDSTVELCLQSCVH